MRSRLLTTILLGLALPAAACQVLWSYDNFKDEPGTTASSSSGGGALSASSSSGGGSTSTSTTGSSSGCAIDDDGDGVLSWMCNLTDPSDPTLDCADHDARAHPDAGFQPTAVVGWDVDGGTRPGLQSFDFDCDGKVTQETPVLDCGPCQGGSNGYAAPVDCGMSAPLGSCGSCGFWCCKFYEQSPLVMQQQRCK